MNALVGEEPRLVAIGQTLQADRRTALKICGSHRLALAQPTVEADRKAPGGIVADRTMHSDDTSDVREQCLGLRVAVASVQHDQLDRFPCSAERLLNRCSRDELSTTVGTLEEQAARWRPINNLFG